MDIFGTEPSEPIKMSQQEFVEKTNALLIKINNAYSQAWQDRPLKDSEYPNESVCYKCTGCGVFQMDDEERDCFINYERGECYHRFCDYEQVGVDIESLIFDTHELLSVDEIN